MAENVTRKLAAGADGTAVGILFFVNKEKYQKKNFLIAPWVECKMNFRSPLVPAGGELCSPPVFCGLKSAARPCRAGGPH